MRPGRTTVVAILLAAAILHGAGGGSPLASEAPLPTPAQFLGFTVGADNKLARWERIVEYLEIAAAASPRVTVRDLGRTTRGNRFVAVEVSSPATQERIDYFKALERKLYFQGGAPTPAQRDEILREGKVVVLVTCNVHSTEIGSSQMVLDLVHRLATGDSPAIRKILDRVILVLVPSLNPDGQIMVTDWFNQNLGTEFEHSPMPWLYHPYAGHDTNRDMYAFNLVESQLTARLLWHDWFPSVWLDEHQMGNSGARIFVMPATDPINPNVHPLIYRWNGLFGQAQAAALEAAGKDGIIHNSTYTNFWQGAMAWSGWWHNQVGLLTEVASVRVAAPIEQLRTTPGAMPPAAAEGRGRGQAETRGPLPAPRDVTPRTEYPRPWLGGRWTLRDIVDYELIATMATLEAAADGRDALLRHIYEVNRATVEEGTREGPAAALIPAGQFDPAAAARLVSRLQLAGVEVWQSAAPFDADGRRYGAGSFVIPLDQVFGRYVKDILEKQTYPEVRRTPASPPEPPYDVTAWSLGMLMGVETVFAGQRVPDGARLQRLTAAPALTGSAAVTGGSLAFEYRGADGAIAVNRLLKAGARMGFAREGAATRVIAIERRPHRPVVPLRAPRVGLYQPWTASMDEGWTRLVLEQFEFSPQTIHNAEIKAGDLRTRFDAIVLPDQSATGILEGNTALTTRPEYRGGIGEEGVRALRSFVEAGGTLIALGAATDLLIDRWPIGVRNLKRSLGREEHFAPGTILRLEVDARSALGAGMPAETWGFYGNSPFFELREGFDPYRATVAVRYPNASLVASGWLRGEELMAGRAAVVQVEAPGGGRLVLFGLRPQHRAQTHATFPLLFNALYESVQ
jgi:hypothetical protein